MDSFNLIAGLCSILSFLLAAVRLVAAKTESEGQGETSIKKGGRASTLTA